MRIIFDNNIWISLLIGKRLTALRSLFERADVEVFFCDELEQEFLDVAYRPKIRKYVSEEQIERVHQQMTACCLRVKVAVRKVPPVRDPKDVYLLALSETVGADYLVSGDSDLTVMGQWGPTVIVNFNQFSSLFGLDE